MKVYGNITELDVLKFREDTYEITLQPNASTTYTANRTISLPNIDAADELVSLAATQTLTNKTLTSPTITGAAMSSPVLTTPQINDTTADHQYIFAVSELAADRTVTLPLLLANDEFVFANHAVELTSKTISAGSNTITGLTNTSIDNAAAIAYSKLNLTSSIVNADVSNSAAIVYSKLALTDGIVNADINSAAAIAYSKLNLATSIVNADIGAAAAIAYSKLAALTASRVLVSDGSGFVSASSVTSTTLGYLDATSSIQTQLDTKITASSTDNLSNKTFTDNEVDFTGTGAINIPAGTTAQQPGSPATGALRFNTTDVTFEGYDGVSWGPIGGGGSGGINYILNPDTETNVDGWVAYDDVAGTTPVDGTGGSPTVTITRSTSTPLRGDANFLITKGAADYQGEGVSYDFTIDRADCNKVLALSFDYDGTLDADYADDDIEVFLYDVTNSTLIYPSGDNGLKRAVTSYAGTWVSTDSTSYRLIFHVATTEAAAYTLSFDNVRVGPQELTFGVPMEDWTTYTQTYTNGPTTPTTLYSQYKRIGDMCRVRLHVNGGTGGAGSVLGIDWDVPNTTPNLADGDYIELGSIVDGGGSYIGPMIGVWSTANNRFTCYYNAGGTTTVFNGSSWTSGRKLVFDFQVPVAEWAGSSVWLSSAKAEYYSSTTGTWDAAAATTNTVIGPAGSPITGSLAANRNKDIQLLSALQPTDRLEMQVNYYGDIWQTIESVYPYQQQSNTEYGARLVPLTATTVRVIFNRYTTPTDGGTYGAAGTDWAADGYWRVVVYPGVIQSAMPSAIKYQTKYLASPTTAVADMTDLTFTGLTVGKQYRLGGQVAFGEANGSNNDKNIRVQFTCSSVIHDIRARSNAIGNWDDVVALNNIFTAAATTMTVAITSNLSAFAQVEGSGGVNGTYVTLEELPYHVEYSGW